MQGPREVSDEVEEERHEDQRQRPVQRIPVAPSFEITTHLHWTWRGHWLSAKGHRIVARFLFDHFPFVPFSLDRVETETQALQLFGRRE